VAAAGPPTPAWFLARKKEKLGPFSLAQLKKMAAAGQLRPEDMLLPEGQGTWTTAECIAGVFSAPQQKKVSSEPEGAVTVADATGIRPKNPRPPVPATPHRQPVQPRAEASRKTRAPRDAEEEEFEPERSGTPVGLLVGIGVGVLALVIAGVVGGIVLLRSSDGDNLQAEAKKTAPEGDPEPVKDPVEKKEIKEPLPEGPMPAQIEGDTVRRVKRSTTYLRVQMADGRVAEGSGFLCVEPGLVMTNAHVLGMMGAESRPPRKVDVVLHSGEPEEKTLAGQVVGVDRFSDLAILRVPQEASLPPPLRVRSAKDLTEVQDVYIFGFPLGAQVGKEITVTKSSITSFRKDKLGNIERIQTNGGMHPGNSGGPVTDARGVVVGVSVAILRGTTISFAVPGDAVQLVLDGRLSDAELAVPYMENGRSILPVKLACIDPLSRIRDVKVEFWAGNPGPGRPLTYQRPQAEAGDGPRQVLSVKYQAGAGAVDIPLPQMEPDKVIWVQPVLTTASGTTHWAAATAYQPTAAPALDRQATIVEMKVPAGGAARTLKLKDTLQVRINDVKGKVALRDSAEYDVRETVTPDPVGAKIQLAFLNCQAEGDDSGVPLRRNPQALQLLSRLPAGFSTDATGAFKGMVATNLKVKNPSIDLDLTELYGRACNAYQTTLVSLPNRSLNPRETWNARPRLLLGSGKGRLRRKVALDLDLTCTYEGLRNRGGRSEAYFTMVGQLKGAGPVLGPMPTGKVKGFAVCDVVGGFLSQVEMSIVTEIEAEGSRLVLSIDTSLTRSLGAASDPGPGPGLGLDNPKEIVGKGQQVLRVMDRLTAADPKDRVRPGFHKVHSVRLLAGSTYTIDMKTREAGFDPYLRLENSAGQQLAEDDDGGGFPNARIVFRCQATGDYRIIATTFAPNMQGQYLLVVRRK
jgi:S1-C subfamily serine protease